MRRSADADVCAAGFVSDVSVRYTRTVTYECLNIIVSYDALEVTSGQQIKQFRLFTFVVVLY